MGKLHQDKRRYGTAWPCFVSAGPHLCAHLLQVKVSQEHVLHTPSILFIDDVLHIPPVWISSPSSHICFVSINRQMSLSKTELKKCLVTTSEWVTCVCPRAMIINSDALVTTLLQECADERMPCRAGPERTGFWVDKRSKRAGSHMGQMAAYLTALGIWSTYWGLMVACRSSSRMRVK